MNQVTRRQVPDTDYIHITSVKVSIVETSTANTFQPRIKRRQSVRGT